MLKQLSIKNYALIEDIRVSFSEGLTTITGETGAGKSILLGGLSLVLGKRADLSSLRNKESKCIIEAEFDVGNYGLEDFFETRLLEYDPLTIIRREIHPGGKSRAFVNDSPVTLDLLSALGRRLVDIHSQHQTLQLTEHDFQLHVIDALGGNSDVLTKYHNCLSAYQQSLNELNELTERQKKGIKDEDYNKYLLEELESAHLEEDMLKNLEEQYEQLNHVELILEQLSASDQMLNDEQLGLVSRLAELRQIAARLSGFGEQYKTLEKRLESVYIEVDDISAEVQQIIGTIDPNPQLLETTQSQLQHLYDLLKKHGESEISGLIRIRGELSEKIFQTENLDSVIEEKEIETQHLKEKLSGLADILSNNRNTVIPQFKRKMEEQLQMLGMPNASFEISLVPGREFKTNGRDNLIFLFSANKGSDYGSLKKVASGGELSRIMLVIKSILAGYEQLPTLIFDEIDSGVSGEISNNMGDIMLGMSEKMQVFAITHLPQVASKGEQHFKVYKEEEESMTFTRIKRLDLDERVVELAEMLGGKAMSDSALAHAKQLLN